MQTGRTANKSQQQHSAGGGLNALTCLR
jgi:hypothetical protein